MNKRQIAKILGSRGGRSRAKRLSSEAKKNIASLGGQARAESIQAKKRILRNFLYLDAVLRLRGKQKKVIQSNQVKKRLPGIYEND
ncbi:MAG: hypothetical protein HY540_05305 [Deltaproteobacteria bacterium]|nr:hypothetical protein [Deltaproteobacteria bacterium]